MFKIDRTLAAQVVNTVKDVCGRDVNFINQYRIIFASTDPERVGTFHEIGHQAALTGETIEVRADDNFHGTRMGINLPVYYNQTFMAVIGITGQPDEVRKYAHLAERITHLLIRERELNTISRNQADKRHFAMDALIHQASANMDYLNACLKECGINITQKYRILLIRAAAESPSDNLSLLQQKPDGTEGILSKDQLRNSKNMFIAGITLFTRATIDGGVPEETAYSLSDGYIQTVEECTNSVSIEKLSQRAAARFAQEVYDPRKRMEMIPYLVTSRNIC